MSKHLFLFFSVLCFPVILSGQVRFSATTERTNIAMGEQIAVVATLVTNRPLKNAGAPPVASTDAFTVINSNSQQSSSTSIQIVNGKTTQTKEITTRFYYSLAPKKKGSFVFPALSVSIGGKRYTTSPISFTVSDQPVQNPDIRTFFTVSRKTLYTGEQAVLTYKVAQRAQARQSTDVSQGFNGALDKITTSFGKDFGLTRLFTNQVTSGTERISGEMYNVYSLRFLLFPLSAGTVTIDPVPFQYQQLTASRRRRFDPFDDFFGGSFFSGGVKATLKTSFSPKLTITVKPLPTPPSDYSGAVGSFSLRANASPLEVPAGEAVTLKVTLKGNTRPANMGDITLKGGDDYELFTPEKSLSIDTGTAGISCRKTYKYLLIPRKEGTLVLPSISYTYFDPVASSYKTASTDTISLTVTKGKGGKKERTRYLTQEEIIEVGRDIRYIKTESSLKNQSRYPYRKPVFFLLFPLPVILMLLSILYRFQSKHKDRNIMRTMRNKALSAASKKLATIKKQGSSIKNDAFLSAIAGTIENYISHKFNFAATGRTLEELKNELMRHTTDEKTVEGLTTFIEKIDHFRFGGAALDENSRREVIEQANTFLTGLEKGTKKEMKKGMKATAMLLIFMIGSAVTHGAPVQHWFEKANTAYKSDQFDTAAAYYQRIIESGINNADVLYNYGNALYRLKKIGNARLAYEKAALLAPNDADIAANIKFIQMNIIDRVPEPQRGLLESVLLRLHTLLPLKKQLWLALILLSTLCILISAGFYVSHNLRLWFIYLSVLCGLILTGIVASIGVKIYTTEKVTYAIVIESSTDAKNEPNGATVLFTAHEGTKFHIRKTADKWALVSLPNGVSGWVEKKALGEI